MSGFIASLVGATYAAAADANKIYFEFEYYAADSNGGWGFTTKSTLSATHPSEQGTDFVGFRSNTATGQNGTGFAINSGLSAYNAATTRFGIALNKSTGSFWVRQGSSSWYVGDPVAGTSAQGTIPSNNASTKLFFTAYTGDYLFAVALANFNYATPSEYTAGRLNTFTTGYTLGSITFSESNYKAQDAAAEGYSGAYIAVPTTTV